MKKGDKSNFSRRLFLKQSGILGAGIVAAGTNNSLYGFNKGDSTIPAVLGGTPVHKTGWTKWPIWDSSTDEELVLKVLRSGVWSRAKVVSEFERAWAEKIGTKRCLAVVNGTNALICALVNMGIGAGDEVIVPPYTFIGTIVPVLQVGAIPVFVDTDPATFQIDPDKIEEKITSRTKAILPVHILGLPADMLKIMDIAKKHNLLVLEDDCQAHLAEINHKKMGTFGYAGCFSFQNSKNMPIGEAGAIVSDDEHFMDKCYSYHNYGNPYGSLVGEVGAGTLLAGTKMRLTEYQAAIGLAQMKRIEEQAQTREKNAARLTSQIKEIPGIIPVKLSPGVTRAVYHLYPFRYNKEKFHNLSRSLFLKALSAEGVHCSRGYSQMNKMPYLNDAFTSKNYKKMYNPEDLDINLFNERNECPKNDKLCLEEAVWLSQWELLGPSSDMDDIAKAIEKIYKNAEKIKKEISI